MEAEAGGIMTMVVAEVIVEVAEVDATNGG